MVYLELWVGFWLLLMFWKLMLIGLLCDGWGLFILKCWMVICLWILVNINLWIFGINKVKLMVFVKNLGVNSNVFENRIIVLCVKGLDGFERVENDWCSWFILCVFWFLIRFVFKMVVKMMINNVGYRLINLLIWMNRVILIRGIVRKVVNNYMNVIFFGCWWIWFYLCFI